MSPPTLRIRVLGPLEVSFGDQIIDVGGYKTRALISRLLIDRNLTVSVDRLLDSLWTDHEGEGAEIALRSTVSRLRKRLRDAGLVDDLIVTRAPGYVLIAEPEMSDVFLFERLVAEGRRQLARRHPEETTRLLAEAQALWRGSAYSEVCDEPFARAEARRLEELRLTALEIRFDAELTIGRHSAIAGELEQLTNEHPMRERLWSQRMLALYRSGRQAEALRVFQELRSILVDELGIEPGHDISWLEGAILEQSPDLEWIRPDDGPADDGPEVRAEARLPATPPGSEGKLVGRQIELDGLQRWWAKAQRGESRLVLIDGEAGIGKTSLATELARAAETAGATVLWGRCDEEPVAPFQPIAEALGRYFGSIPAEEIIKIPEWRLSELSRLVLRLSEHVADRDLSGTDPEGDRYRFFGAVTATLSDMASRGPVLLVLDDLHWADQPTLLLLRHLLRNGEGPSPGIVGLYRDTDVDHLLRSTLADFHAEKTSERIHLHGLTAEAVGELVSSLSGKDAGLAEQLFALTDGNPLFLDELVRQLTYASEASAQHPDDIPVPPDLTTPDAVKELVARRVSRLPDEVIRFLHAASVAGPECDASIVATAAELTSEQRLDALDRAVESRLLRRRGDSGERYVFSHALVREAIYGELLRGRRVRYHHKIALATEKAHGDAVDQYVNELAHHFYMGAALADADKAVKYTAAAGDRALRLLAFEEAIEHYQRGLEVTELYGDFELSTKCDALLALGEAQNRAGDKVNADLNFERAAALARIMHDPERLASAAFRAGPLSYMGIVGANADQVRLLEEARQALDEGDSHIRVMITARLGLVMIYEAGVPEAEVRKRALELGVQAISMARRLGDRVALGYALNARLHALWGIEPAPERLAIGTELGQIAEDVGDELLALHGHMWRVRELLAQGDVEAVNEELERFGARDIGPREPLAAAYACNVQAMMALVRGDIAEGERLAPLAVEIAEGYHDLALSFFGVLLAWTWWQQDILPSMEETFREILDSSPADYPVVRAALALLLSELGRDDEAVAELDRLAELGWEAVSDDQTEGVSLAYVAAACGNMGDKRHAEAVYEHMRPYAGTAIVVRAPASACYGPADFFLGLLASASGDVPLAEVHFESALRMAKRMNATPFIAAAEVELARTLRLGGRDADLERIASLLRSAEESAVRMGLTRIARRAVEAS